jgi:hypothetical protein
MSSQTQNKLMHYEISPPPGVWNKIAASLDENISPALFEKLYNYQEAPPAIAWQNLSVRLNDLVTPPSKVIPFYIRYRRPLKYSGAIAIFTVLAVLTSLLVSKKTESEIPARGIINNHSPLQKSTPQPINDRKGINPLTETAERMNAKPSNTSIDPTREQAGRMEPDYPNNSSFNQDKYITYSDANGRVIRLPKKILTAFTCSTGDARCKQRLQKLRQKFAESAVTADFTGLLQILKSLQENQ